MMRYIFHSRKAVRVFRCLPKAMVAASLQRSRMLRNTLVVTHDSGVAPPLQSLYISTRRRRAGDDLFEKEGVDTVDLLVRKEALARGRQDVRLDRRPSRWPQVKLSRELECPGSDSQRVRPQSSEQGSRGTSCLLPVNRRSSGECGPCQLGGDPGGSSSLFPVIRLGRGRCGSS